MTGTPEKAKSPDLAEVPLVLVPTGATEQHGPHLPVGTDTLIAEQVSWQVADRLRNSGRRVWVAPALPYGASGEHDGFPGVMSIGTEALRFVLVELMRSLSSWARRVVFVNGHGGNLTPLCAAVAQLRHEQHDVSWVPCTAGHGDAHAGHTETSLMLHLAPETVDMSSAVPGNPASTEELLPTLIESGVAAVSASGVLGDPTTATAAEGARLLECIVQDVHARIVRARPDQYGCLMHAEPVRAVAQP